MEQKPKLQNNIQPFFRTPETAILSPSEKIESITKMIYSLREELIKIYAEHDIHGDLSDKIDDLKTSITILDNHYDQILNNQIKKAQASNDPLFHEKVAVIKGLNIISQKIDVSNQELPTLTDNYEEID